MKTKFLATLVLSIGLSTGAQAALFDRGSGMVYDSTQDITWAADANLAQTSMTWGDAVAWAGKLDLGGHSGWRLPTLSLGAGNQADNEMGHLFDVDLAGAAIHGVINIQDLNYWSGTVISSTEALSFAFKEGTQSTSDKKGSYSDKKGSYFYAWAVHKGDVANMPRTITSVPVPAAIWLFGSGLIALLGVKRFGNIG